MYVCDYVDVWMGVCVREMQTSGIKLIFIRLVSICISVASAGMHFTFAVALLLFSFCISTIIEIMYQLK